MTARNDHEVLAAFADHHLRADVAGSEEDARRDAERDSPLEDRLGERDRDGGGPGGRSEPHRDQDPVGARPVLGAARQRDPEQREPADRDDDSESLPGAEGGVGRLGDEEREDADPARRDRLDERERRERDRRHVEDEARRLGAEADQPPPVAEQQPERAKRRPGGERRELRGRRVLGEVAPVDEARRDQCQPEPEKGLPVHGCRVQLRCSRALRDGCDCVDRRLRARRGRGGSRSASTRRGRASRASRGCSPGDARPS